MSKIIRHNKISETFNTIKNHLYPMSKREKYKLKYGDRISRGALTPIIFHTDKGAEELTKNSLIYATYLLFAMHSLKSGGTMNVIIPVAINKDKQIKQFFNIPKQHGAIISIIFCYPKYKYQKTVKR